MRLQVGRGQKLGDGPGAMEFGDMTVEGLLQVRLRAAACCACSSLCIGSCITIAAGHLPSRLPPVL